MGDESASQVLRHVRALYALGRVADLTDAQLLGAFLDGDVPGREEAFAALVRRHGPMVLGVCRRGLANAADAEDAFQATFLVLAKKAGSIRRLDGLKSWLHGVATRAAKESRRRSARVRAMEAAAMDQARGRPAQDEDRIERLALLDEEIGRLPARLREPLLLCELEGSSRQDAALRLGLPQGTLSSRLSRGRSLLRERLTRRGVSLGVGASASIASGRALAAPPDPLVDSTVHLALKFATAGVSAGAIPAAVSSLAEGVIAMLNAAKRKLVLAGAIALGASASLLAGLAQAVGPKPVASLPKDPPKAVVKVEAAAVVDGPTASQDLIRGVVVDESGRPVAGVSVQVGAFTDRESSGVSGADGSFAIPLGGRQINGTALLARSDDGRLAGVFRYDWDLTIEQASTPARVVLKPGRKVAVRVADAAKAPVEGAAVEVTGGNVIYDHATTDVEGSVRLLVPADAKVQWIVSVKPGRGFDYAEFGPIDDAGRSDIGVSTGELPASVALTLEGGRTVRIKSVDREGSPLIGVGFTPWLLQKEGRKSQLNYSTRIFTSVTGTDGIATFDWLRVPKDPIPSWRTLTFWPQGDRFAHRRVAVKDTETGVVTATMAPSQAIRGRVVRGDNSPASGIKVSVLGTGNGMDHGQASARTEADGTYEIVVGSGEAYAVFVVDKDWAAPSRMDVVLHAKTPAEGVDFTITRGTIIRGKVTVGPGNLPAPEEMVSFDENGGSAPRELLVEGNLTLPEVRRQLQATTDADGRYSIRVGPGTYHTFGPARAGAATIVVTDESEIIHDFRMPRPRKGPIAGRVVSGREGKAVAKAEIDIIAINPVTLPFRVTADADGRFLAERDLDPLVICATSPDRTLAAIVTVGAEDAEVAIPVYPTASATGRLLDGDGEPAAKQSPRWGRRVYIDEAQTQWMTCFGSKVITDADGRFTLPGLVVGQEYEISLEKDDHDLAAGVIRPEEPRSIDLGTLRAGSYRAKGENTSSFTASAPKSGDIAPAIEATTLDGKPLSLADFRGKYVLLDFWATWCGPCIGEIPRLQAVHDAFGKDERFAILSVSVDETIDEPRKFQEARKLPWSQAYLAGGMHGPTPGSFGVRAIPAFVLIGPDGKIIARGMRSEGIKAEVAKALAKRP